MSVAMPSAGKENVAHALAGSLQQMQQKVAVADAKSVCSQLDAGKEEGVSAYTDLQGKFNEVKAKYLQASAKLYFLNMISADKPLDEVQGDLDSKLAQARNEIATAVAHQASFSETHNNERAAVVKSRQALAAKMQEIQDKLQKLQNQPSTQSMLNQIKASTFEAQTAKLESLKQQREALQRQVEEVKARKEALDQELHQCHEKQSALSNTDSAQKTGSSQAQNTNDEKFESSYKVTSAAFGASVAPHNSHFVQGCDTQSIHFRFGNVDTTLSVSFKDSAFHSLQLQPLLVPVDDLAAWARERSQRAANGDNNKAILAWIAAEVKARLVAYVPGQEPVAAVDQPAPVSSFNSSTGVPTPAPQTGSTSSIAQTPIGTVAGALELTAAFAAPNTAESEQRT